MPKQTVFALVTFLHDLFTAIWIGALFALLVAVLPGLRQALGMGPQLKKTMDAIQRRLSVAVYISMAGLWVTGVLLARRASAFQGFLSFADPYSTYLSLKHILVIAMVVISLYRSIALVRRGGAPTPAQEKVKTGLLIVNLLFGIAVLLLSGLTTAYGMAPPAPRG